MDYTQFAVEDFASDEYFLRWVLDRDPEAEQFWSIFVLTNPHLEFTIDQARALVLNIGVAESRKQKKGHVDVVWSRIQDSIAGAPAPREVQSRPDKRKHIPLFVAVCVALAALFLIPKLKTLSDEGHHALASDGFVEEINESGTPIRLLLSDSSAVDLDHGSRLRYKQDYRGSTLREVYLTGSAFFNVRKNAAQPFIVRSNEVIAEALETSFQVYVPKNESEVVIRVRTGSVTVYSADADKQPSESEGVFLLPNQEATFIRDQLSFNKKLVDDPAIVQPEFDVNEFAFENTPIEEVFERLELAYGIEILFDTETMENCFLSALLASEPFFEKLRVICDAIGASYELVDAKIRISSSGC